MEGSLLLSPSAPLHQGQRGENGQEGAQPQGVPSQDPGPWAWSQIVPGGEVGRGRERSYLHARLRLVDPVHIGKNIGTNRNYLPCHKIRQPCPCITPSIDVSGLGLVFSVQAVLQCQCSPVSPRH